MDLNRFFLAAKAAVPAVASLSDAVRGNALRAVADVVDAQADAVLAANAADLARMDAADPKFDRLKLTRERLAGVAADMRRVAELPSPLGKTLAETTRPNGLKIRKISVPFGVVGVIYEARPNVTLDVFGLCLKSGNVCLLKGARDAAETNAALAEIVRAALRRCGVPADACVLLPPEREAATALLRAVGNVDLVVPRGSRALIDFVRENARVPVIETGAGVCHAFLDTSADLKKARDIVLNAKTRRVSVCNALDCVLVHEGLCGKIGEILAPLADFRVRIFADEKIRAALAGTYPAELLESASETSFGTEFLDYKMSARVVPDLDAALAHIAAFGSKHSECVVAEDERICGRFLAEVDAACVYANASTAFTDGGEFGFGAEVGISTQKLHARGPMGLPELTTYKYVVRGNGQIRA